MDSSKSADEYADAHTHQHRETKRRKVRKGTHSCWECKRRKMKCIGLDSRSNAACNSCRRRGSKCIPQEYPEDAQLSPCYTDTGSHARTSTTPGADRGWTDGMLTPASMSLEPSRHLPPLAFYQSTAGAGTLKGNHDRLSRFLHQSLPSRSDLEMIINASRHPFVPVLAHQILTVPYTTLRQTGLTKPESLLHIPEPDQHPVLIARYMLELAIFLQHLHPNIHKNMMGLSETPRMIRERLADLANGLVTKNDEFTGSIEGLGCVMLDSMYQANVGSLRRSWLTGRRAITIAQLMGLDGPDNRAQYKVLDSKTEHHPQFMWFRIIYLDRLLSLMLGLPPGPLDNNMLSDAMLGTYNDTIGGLEWTHTVLASRILKRNKSKKALEDLALTRTMDEELQKAARSLPSKWWLAPTLDNVASADSEALYWDTRRLFAQILHFNLLSQLHLPYMLRSSSAPAHQQEYSAATCANASREILSRFTIFRNFKQVAYGWSCRIVDCLALMAAMTLLLAHIDSYRCADARNRLAHQYVTDRAMIEQAQENMEEVNRLNSDALSAQSAELLRRLLAVDVEADEANGCFRRVTVQDTEVGPEVSDHDADDVVCMHIPYFGTIRISSEGVSKEVLTRPAAASNEASLPSNAGNSNLAALTSTNVEDIGTTCLTGQLQSEIPGSVFQPEEYPDLAAVGEDWAFQGVDLTFFDSLMMGA